MPRNRATSEEFVEVHEEPVKRTIAEELEQMKIESQLDEYKMKYQTL